MSIDALLGATRCTSNMQGEQVCKALLRFLDRISGVLLPPKDAASRRPEALSLRPLPQYDTLDKAKKVQWLLGFLSCNFRLDIL